MNARTICCVGGGTAGSVIPLVVLLQWRRRLAPESASDRVLWVRTYSNIETPYIPSSAIIARIVTAKWHRYWTIRHLFTPLKFTLACAQAFWYCVRYRPSVIWTAGSFAAVPMVWVGWCLGIPSITIQQDVERGLANRLMEPFATQRYSTILPKFIRGPVPYPYRWIGVLSRYDQRCSTEKSEPHSSGDRATKKMILVLGGSSGAQGMNKVIQQVLPLLPSNIRVIHSTGVVPVAPKTIRCEYRAYPSIGEELRGYYAKSDIVITRAGMNALSECALFSNNCIVIPLPSSHQQLNANLIKKHHAGVVLEEHSLTPQIVFQTIQNLLNDPTHSFGSALHQLFTVASEDHIAEATRV